MIVFVKLPYTNSRGLEVGPSSAQDSSGMNQFALQTRNTCYCPSYVHSTPSIYSVTASSSAFLNRLNAAWIQLRESDKSRPDFLSTHQTCNITASTSNPPVARCSATTTGLEHNPQSSWTRWSKEGPTNPLNPHPQPDPCPNNIVHVTNRYTFLLLWRSCAVRIFMAILVTLGELNRSAVRRVASICPVLCRGASVSSHLENPAAPTAAEICSYFRTENCVQAMNLNEYSSGQRDAGMVVLVILGSYALVYLLMKVGTRTWKKVERVKEVRR
jgi:hypothetical protein